MCVVIHCVRLCKGVLVINPALAPPPVGVYHMGDNIIVDDAEPLDDAPGILVRSVCGERMADLRCVEWGQASIRRPAGQRVRTFACANRWYCFGAVWYLYC